MKTIRITVDEPLLRQIDHLADNRSAFIREAVKHYLKVLRLRRRESQHRRGYEQHPVGPGEFDVWEQEQVWGDE